MRPLAFYPTKVGVPDACLSATGLHSGTALSVTDITYKKVLPTHVGIATLVPLSIVQRPAAAAVTTP